MKKSAEKTSGNGFTLLELLVSMAITSIIITSLVSITNIALDIWNNSRSEVRATLQSKAMIESMAADFESMVVRPGNTFEWLYAKTETSTSGPNSNPSPNSVDLIFFSAATDRYDGKIGEAEDDGGDVSTIAYRLAYTDPIGGGDVGADEFKTFVLYRKIVDPLPTFQNLLGQTDLKQAFNLYAPAAGADAIDAPENFICENIYQFTVTFHIETVNSDGQAVSVPLTMDQNTSTQKFGLTGEGITFPETTEFQAILDDLEVAKADLGSGRLNSVEIHLSVLTDAGLRQMKGRSFTDDALDEFITENSYQFSKLIPVPSY